LATSFFPSSLLQLLPILRWLVYQDDLCAF